MNFHPPQPREIQRQALRRRTFAVISHPDAGKSTLTEALALHAKVIGQAGATHGKAGRRTTVSDWMSMEVERGISISSTALQFSYRDAVINLLDTPGHADFSEDTYRVLAAVDCAVMLIDAAKGLELQTMKLFQVCKYRKIPIITVINKWDRPGKEPLELMDEIYEETGLLPTPLTWPVGESGNFQGVLNRDTGTMTQFTRRSAGAEIADERTLTPEEAATHVPESWNQAVEETSLLDLEEQNHDQSTFLAGETTPVLFAAAVVNFGVRTLLDTLVDIAPAPAPRLDIEDNPRLVEADFSGFVFKVQAGMDTRHRDRLAFIRVCSGVFERGMVVTHAATGKPFATKYAQQVFGRDREIVDTAYPGDVVGLVNAQALRVGDSLFAETPVHFPSIPSFSPEHFRVIRAKHTAQFKQFRRGVQQLDHEGVIQVLNSDLRGEQAPVLGAVGPMQFDVVEARMENEFGAACSLEPLAYSLARRTDEESQSILATQRGVEVLRRSDGELLALFSDKWRLAGVEREHPELTLEPLVVS